MRVHVGGGLGRRDSASNGRAAREQLVRDHGERVPVARGRRAFARSPARARGSRLCRARSRSPSSSRALPRSRSRSPRRARGRSRSRSRFAGLTSRWTMPFACAASSAEAASSSQPAPAASAPAPRLSAVGDRAAAEVLHDDERPLVPLADVEDRDRRVLARQPRGRERLPLEALPHRGVLRVALREHLDRDLRPRVVSSAR